MSLGVADAEEDEHYLDTCFVEIDEFEVVTDLGAPQCIVLGRTGTGKTATIINIAKKFENTIELKPSDLALRYVSNSEIIKFFSEIGLKLDVFYQLLWRHVLCVELLKFRFKIKNKGDFSRLVDWVMLNVSGKGEARNRAIQYLTKWESSFWAETEERIKEITRGFEEKLQLETGVDAKYARSSISGASTISEAEKSEIIHKAQKVVHDAQIKELGEVISLMGTDLFTSREERYFLLIDKLDEDWVEDALRYKLVRALIEAIKTFRRIPALKIVIAIRTDLLDRVYEKTRDAGFQREKYNDLNLELRWNEASIREILDKRVDQLLQEQYTKVGVTLGDILPENIDRKDPFKYIVERTLMRPRDAIAFMNQILIQARQKDQITAQMIRDAEKPYSAGRRSALCDEWFAEYPYLDLHLKFLEQRPWRFSLDEIESGELDDFVIQLLQVDTDKTDKITLEAEKQLEGVIKRRQFLIELVQALYKTGALGIKPSNHAIVSYCYNSTPILADSAISDESLFYVHPMLWRAFGVFKDGRSQAAKSKI